MKPDEAAFETHITEWLTDHGGYAASKLGTQSTDFDVNGRLDAAELVTFIEATQPDEWAKVLESHGGNADSAQDAFIDRLRSESRP